LELQQRLIHIQIVGMIAFQLTMWVNYTGLGLFPSTSHRADIRHSIMMLVV